MTVTWQSHDIPPVSGMDARHELHLTDQPGPVALLGEVHADVGSIPVDGSDDPHTLVSD